VGARTRERFGQVFNKEQPAELGFGSFVHLLLIVYTFVISITHPGGCCFYFWARGYSF
jgi:hypothetical protein